MNMLDEAGDGNPLAAKGPITSTSLPLGSSETPHQRVFRLIKEKKFEAASRLAKTQIDDGYIDGFFIYGGTTKFAAAEAHFRKQTSSGAKAKMAAVEKITPELAQAMLGQNAGNRRIRAKGLAARLRDIAEGRWEITGQPIIISNDARVNDGQHRLFAILLLGAEVETFVVYGTTRASALPIDTGETRVSGDRFALANITNASRVASVVRFANKVLLGRDPTEAELLDLYHADAERYQFAFRMSSGFPKNSPFSGLGAAAYLLVRNGARRAEVETFFTQMRLGDGLARHSATMTLREDFLAKKTRLTPAAWATTIYALFGEWRQGRRVKLIEPVLALPTKETHR